LTDITEGIVPRGAFAQAMQEAEAAAATEQLGAPPEVRARDEQGRYVAAETPAIEVPAAAPDEVTPPVEAEPETPAETLLAGKYKTQEELERGYLELQDLTARTGTERGEERALLQAYAERLAVLEAQSAQTPHRQITPDFIEQNPSQAAQLAYEQGDTVALGNAYQQWTLEDPAAAATWVGEKRLQEAQTTWAAEQKAFRDDMESRFAPLQQQNEQASLRDGVLSLPDEVRTFLSDAPTVQALANEFPTLGKDIANGSVSERINAINALHGIHRGRTADTLNQAVTDVARTTAEQAQAARDEAYVASSTASQAETLTWEQQEQAKAVKAFTRAATTWDEALVIPAKK